MPFEQTNCARFFNSNRSEFKLVISCSEIARKQFFCLFRSYNTFYRVDRAILNYPVDRTENIRGNTIKH